MNSSISRWVTGGASKAFLDATIRTASIKSSGGAFLSRRPLTPARNAPKMYSSRSRAVFDFAGMPFLTDFLRDDVGDVKWVRFSGRLSPRVD